MIIPKGYQHFLTNLKTRIRSAQLKASVQVNIQLLHLYWDLGRNIVERQEKEGWGTGVIRKLARDLQTAFPKMSGFSESNIWRMRSFYLAYPENRKKLAQPVRELKEPKLPQAVAEIPWGHHVLLLEKIKHKGERNWYAQKTLENGWSRAVLWHQVDSNLFKRQKKNPKSTNFSKTLPAPQSDLAQALVKDPYNFDFLSLKEEAHERDLERGLLRHLREFLVELGKGFSFVGSQYPLKVDTEDFFIDLLFYHLQLRCFVAIELKMTPFKPEYAGKMNFYLSAIDDLIRHPQDNPSIGIILCKTRNRVVVEYSLKDTHKPIGVSAYRMMKSLPQKLKRTLPTIRELETELGDSPKRKKKGRK